MEVEHAAIDPDQRRDSVLSIGVKSTAIPPAPVAVGTIT